MTELKITDGPWYVGRREPARVFNKNSHLVVDCDREHKGWPIFENRAHLIASAPKLYEMLERTREVFPTDSERGREIDAALAAARGETE